MSWHWKAFVLRPDDIDLPDLGPAEAIVHARLLRAIQTGCATDMYWISMLRNELEDDLEGAVAPPETPLPYG